MSSRGPGDAASSVLRKLLALLLLGGWVALLQTPALQPSGIGRTPAVARLLPFGMVAVFAFRDRGFWLLRALLVGLPAFVLGLAAAAVAVWVPDRAAGPPGPSDLLPAALAVALGVLVGLAWRRGPGSLLLLPFKLAAVLALLAILASGLLLASLEPQPTVGVPRPLGPEDERHLAGVFAGKDPRALPPGETCRLTLEQADAERLLNQALPLLRDPGRARGAVAFAEDRLILKASLRAPLLARWLNLSASVRPSVQGGQLSLREPRLAFGRRSLPHWLMDALAPVLQQALRAERPLRPVLAALRELRVEPGALSAVYGHMDTLPGQGRR